MVNSRAHWLRPPSSYKGLGQTGYTCFTNVNADVCVLRCQDKFLATVHIISNEMGHLPLIRRFDVRVHPKLLISVNKEQLDNKIRIYEK